MASNATPVTSGPVVTAAASVSGVAANNGVVVGFDVKKMARKDREFLGEFDAQVKGKSEPKKTLHFPIRRSARTPLVPSPPRD